MALRKIEIKCKCNHTLSKTNINPDNKGKVTGTITCKKCKKDMRYEIVGDKVTVYEKER